MHQVATRAEGAWGWSRRGGPRTGLEGALGVTQSSQVSGLEVGIKEAVKDEGMVGAYPFLCTMVSYWHPAAPFISVCH